MYHPPAMPCSTQPNPYSYSRIRAASVLSPRHPHAAGATAVFARAGHGNPGGWNAADETASGKSTKPTSMPSLTNTPMLQHMTANISAGVYIDASTRKPPSVYPGVHVYPVMFVLTVQLIVALAVRPACIEKHPETRQEMPLP